MSFGKEQFSATVVRIRAAASGWHELIGIDVRSLALFRIVIAITVLVDLFSFWPELRLFLTDEGMCPRFCAMEQNGSRASFSLFYLHGSYWFTQTLFIITALASIALLLGYYTRVAVVVCWIMVASLNVRITPYWYYADTLLALLLFWSMFLPLGAYFSVDRALARKHSPPLIHASVASLAILLQHTYIYTMGALLKFGAWLDQTAIEAAVSIVQYRSPYSAILEQFPSLMRFLTEFVYQLELYTLPLMFIPFFNATIRLAVVALLMLMHLGFVAFLHVGYFPLVSIAGLLLFIPKLFWEKINGLLNRNGNYAGVIIYYDGDCEFCKKTCLILREFSIFRGSPILPAQDVPEIHEILRKENSWVVRNHRDQLLLRWEAVNYFCLRSPLFWPIGLIFSLPFMRSAGAQIYYFIARHRGRLGKLSAHLLPYREEATAKPSIINAPVVAALAAITLLANIRHIDGYQSLPFPEIFTSTLNLTRLSQKWNMFGNPPRYGLWATIEGRRADGQSVNLLYPHSAPSGDAVPTQGWQAYPSLRWAEIFILYNWKRYGKLYGSAICREYNKDQGMAALQRVTVIRHRQENRPGTPRATWPVRKRILLNYPCPAQ